MLRRDMKHFSTLDAAHSRLPPHSCIMVRAKDTSAIKGVRHSVVFLRRFYFFKLPSLFSTLAVVFECWHNLLWFHMMRDEDFTVKMHPLSRSHLNLTTCAHILFSQRFYIEENAINMTLIFRLNTGLPSVYWIWAMKHISFFPFSPPLTWRDVFSCVWQTFPL